MWQVWSPESYPPLSFWAGSCIAGGILYCIIVLLAEKDQGVLADSTAEHEPVVCLGVAKKANSILACIQNSVASGAGE